VSVLGDFEPEDEYDASDPIPVRLVVISKIVAALDAEPDELRRALRRTLVAALIRRLVDELESADG